MRNLLILILLLSILTSCIEKQVAKIEISTNPYILVLGNAQDAGYPQAGCEKECCQLVYRDSENARFVSSIALIDPISKENWIFDATPDFSKQLKLLSTHLGKPRNLPNGIFLTHAHIGHYTGLMNLGREAMGAKGISVFAMPKMKSFLEVNGPWSQLVELNNIALKSLKKDSVVVLNKRISITPIQVPHRDEYSETVGYLINANSKKTLFIPDINKWAKWKRNITAYIKEVDVALLDATFFKDGEIKGRPMNEIPHPFAEESMALFKELSDEDKKKVHFIHFNHTNPLLIEGSNAQKTVMKNGFNIAEQGMVIDFN
ncbi:MAG: pyrroloquinoline quinone biosynthesis protein PqqB [Lutibacter sp.]|nr:MAG: pyrroloquinoline quinone biosynthesis protein PqqB [Lutibacter sp.]